MTKKIIGFKEFNELSKKEQLEILRRDGAHVGKRRLNGQTILLFQLHSFYVEVHYKYYRKEIENIVITNNIDIVQPYLDQIQIKGFEK